MKKVHVSLQGTVWEGRFPKIGIINPGILELLKRLHNAGYEIIINDEMCVTNYNLLYKSYKYLLSKVDFTITLSDVFLECIGQPISSSKIFLSCIDLLKKDKMLDVEAVTEMLEKLKIIAKPALELEFDIIELQMAPEVIDDMLDEYEIVQWPEIQDLMDYTWFREECLLLNSEEQLEEFGSSAYLVPKERLMELDTEPITPVENLGIVMKSHHDKY